MEREIKISLGGDPTIIPVIRDSLNALDGFKVVSPDEIEQSDIIYWVYGKGPSIKDHLRLWLKKKPLIINHWVGTDVLNEQEKNCFGIHGIKNRIQDLVFYWKQKNGGLIVLANSYWLAEELSKLNIQATYMPITTINPEILGPVDPHPEKDIDFFSYVQFSRFEFYGGDKIVKLAERWPDYTFVVKCIDLDQIPRELTENMPKNISFIPRQAAVELPRLYQRSKFFIRYTQHDGVSLSVLEALYFNLQVLWTYDFPNTYKIDTFEKLSASVPSLIENWRPNQEGHAFIIDNFTLEKWQKKFLEIVQR
jgi:hypothetical protein